MLLSRMYRHTLRQACREADVAFRRCAALLTPNARQNVVTVRRRTGPNGRSSGLISPQPLKAAKRLRMEVRLCSRTF